MKSSAEIKGYYDNFQFKFRHNVRHFIVINKLVKAGLKNTDSVLEIGCGNGAVTKLIAEKVTKGKVTGLDISSESIAAAKINLKSFSYVNFVASNVTDYETNDKFDVVVLSDVLEHIPIEYHDALFNKIHKLLNTNGFVFINIPEPKFLEWTAIHEPEKLQVVDQPLHADILITTAYKNGFYLKELSSYSIYYKMVDSQAIIFTKRETKFEKESYPRHKIIAKKTWARLLNIFS
jgi:trans-aconitate 2-methyltransferase